MYFLKRKKKKKKRNQPFLSTVPEGIFEILISLFDQGFDLFIIPKTMFCFSWKYIFLTFIVYNT